MNSCSVMKLCLTLCNSTDCSTPGFSVLYHLPEFDHTHIHWVGDAIQPSHPVTPFSSCPQSFPTSRSFPMSRLFESSSQRIGASTSVLPVNLQGWFPLGLTGLISLLSKGLSRVFSSTRVQKHQFWQEEEHRIFWLEGILEIRKPDSFILLRKADTQWV